jgi:hypothetical protein
LSGQPLPAFQQNLPDLSGFSPGIFGKFLKICPDRYTGSTPIIGGPRIARGALILGPGLSYLITSKSKQEQCHLRAPARDRAAGKLWIR